MRRLLPTLVLVAAACGPPAKPATTAVNNAAPSGPDSKSGPDGKRSGAKDLKPNSPTTDEVSTPNGDKTDWYKVQLNGSAGVLNTILNWDSPGSDLMIDVFDAVGAQIAASPVRGKGEQNKKLLTQIDKPGTYYIRVTAAGAQDASVYTIEAKWNEPPPVAVVPPPPPEEPVAHEPKHPHHEPREPREPKAVENGPTLEGRIVSAYREGDSLTLQIDKGSGQGVRTGMNGSILNGPSGQDPLDGAAFRVTSVLGPNKCLAKTSAHSIGKNNRVMITLSK